MWEKLRLNHYPSRRERLLRQQQADVRRIHDLEQEIERLRGMPLNEGRSQMIAYLAKQLAHARHSLFAQAVRGRVQGCRGFAADVWRWTTERVVVFLRPVDSMPCRTS